MSTTLTDQIRRGETDAVATAITLGSASVPTLLSLAADPDPEVRLGAIRCLDAVGGPEAQSAAVAALTDQDPQVASRAAALLLRHPPEGRGNDLLLAFRRVRDDEVRPSIALAAGRIDGIDPAPWVAALAAQPPGEVADALLVATARMGHAASRQAFLARLREIDARLAQSWIGHARSMGGPWVAPGLRPLLDRREVALTLAADSRPVQIRVCDLAAGAIVESIGAQVPFGTRGRRLTLDEVEAVRRLAGG